jgi:hypothetical protein
MARPAIHRYCTPGIESRQAATYHRSKVLACVTASVKLKHHIEDIAVGFISPQAKAAILSWKMATEEAQPSLSFKGED